MKNSTIFKRIGAYLIDFLVITLISMAIVRISFINPHYEKYQEVSENYTEKLNDFYNNKISQTEFNEYVTEMSYDMNKNGQVYLACDIVVVILYFGVFAYFTKGRTIGKRMMGIKITSAKDKPLKIYNYIIRSIILNGIIMDIVTLIGINFNKSTYYQIYSVGSNLNYALLITIFLMIMFTKDGRGIHDYLAGTKVVIANEDTKENDEDNEKGEVIKPQKKKNTKKEEEKENE